SIWGPGDWRASRTRSTASTGGPATTWRGAWPERPGRTRRRRPLPEGLRPPGEALGQRDRGVPGGGRGAAAQGRAPHRRVLRRLDSRAGRPLAQAVSQDGGGPRRGGAGPLVEHRRALPPGLRRPAAGGRPAGGGVREGAGPAREGEGTAAAGGARKAQGAR